jgi:Ca2+-binding RTX toxin-like protein
MATINGTAGNDTLAGTSGNDTINALDGNDIVLGASGGDDVVHGGAGFDSIEFRTAATSALIVNYAAATITGGGSGTISFTSIERVVAGNFNDVLDGTTGGQNLTGQAGNDTLWGAAGVDTLWGGSGNDAFIFRETGSANADGIRDFSAASDKLWLDRSAMAALGVDGNFAAGDERFAANSTGTAQDASDRVIFQTGTGQVWYDADGSGAGARQLIATLQSGATLSATNIVVVGDPAPGVVTGTEGDDSLVGSAGNDTINGLGGNDTLDGLAGDDLLFGGDGNDVLHDSDNFDDPGNDTLDGGLGDDTYDLRGNAFQDNNPTLVDAGGIDTVLSNRDFVLPDGFENLELFEGAFGTGNALNNVITTHTNEPGTYVVDGADGNDTLIGGADQDFFGFLTAGSGDYGDDVVDGGDHFDSIFLTGAHSAVLVDMRAGILTGGGIGGSGSVSYSNVESIQTGSFDDRLIAHDGVTWVDPDGVHFGGPSLFADAGNDTLIGGAANDHLQGAAGNDMLSGRADIDVLIGGAGNDGFVFDVAPGAANADHIRDFVSASDEIHLDNSTHAGLGEAGTFGDGDPRFAANATGTPPGSATRVIYDTSTGELWYDSDGTGSSAAQLIATLDGAPALAATDIVVVGPDQGVMGTTGDDSLAGTPGNDTIHGFGGNDTIDGLGGTDLLFGGSGDDAIHGGTANDDLIGEEGNDLLSGGAGNDFLRSDMGNDRFLFDVAPGASNSDLLHDFDPEFDKIVLDGAVHAGIGQSGNFAPDDERFAANTSGSAQDASDRVIYNTANGDLWYDADGNGAGAAQLIGRVREVTTLSAANIEVINGSSGQVINGTAGNDSLAGGEGNDTISGLDGQDTITGLGGDDSLSGGAGFDHFEMALGSGGSYGSDSIDGGADFDTLSFEPHAQSALVVDLTTGTVSGGGAGGSGSATLAGIEGVLGTVFADRITGSASGDGFDGKAGNDTLIGLAGNDSFEGGDGDDLLDGGAGVDVMAGDAGDDTYVVTAGDALSDSGGIDTVMTGITWSLGTAFENLTMTGTGNITMQGNNLDNLIIGNEGNNTFNARAGDDTIMAGGGNDRIDMFGNGFASYGNEVVDGGAGIDNMDFSGYAKSGIVVNLATGQVSGGGDGGSGTVAVSNVETVITGAFNDRFTGSSGADRFDGRGGNDTFSGGGGNDTLSGGTGNDVFVFDTAPGSGNVERITDFSSAPDQLQFENAIFTAIGGAGTFASGDGRFWAASGATSGHDANDRVVYNISTGNLYYDADGSGAGASQLVATFQGNPAIAATDITVI